MAITLDETALLTTVNGSSVAGNLVTVVDRLTTFEGSGGCCQSICIKVNGVNGLTPTFRFNTTQPYQGGFAPVSTERFFYSYDLLTWFAFDQASVAGTGYYDVTNSTAFVQNTVWVSRDRREGTLAVSTWLAALAAANPSKVTYLNGKSSFDLFTYTNQTNELGATIPGQKVYGWLISDPALGTVKRRVAIVSGVHASECIGTTVHRAIANLWVGASAEAINLRTVFDLVSIAPWNSMGIEGGHVRAQFQTSGSANDSNRHMNTTPALFEEVGLNRQVLLDNLPVSRTPFLLDLHGQFGVGSPAVNYFGGSGGFSPLNNTFGPLVNLYTPTGYLGDSVPADYFGGFLDAWAFTVLGCPLSTTVEFNMTDYAQLTDAKIADYAAAIVHALSDMVTAGNFGLSFATATPFGRRAA